MRCLMRSGHRITLVLSCQYRVGEADFNRVGKGLQFSILDMERAGAFKGMPMGMFAND
jgi:hypothetical protein